jgi:hypothetical protein
MRTGGESGDERDESVIESRRQGGSPWHDLA